VLSFRFAPSGKHCASGSHDKDIFLWEVYGDCVNYGVLKGHKQAVLEIAWSPDSEHIWSCSADKLVMLWDAETGKRIKKMPGHSSFVNTVCTTRQGIALGASGSDDGVIKIWDPRVRGAVSTLPDLYQVTAVQFADDGDRVFTGGLDNEIKIWDLRKEEVALSMVGHTDTVTGLRISPDGNTLLSNGMDNTLRIWDTRPFCEGSRCKMVFSGHMHNFEKQLIRCAWSPTGDRVAAGSADKMVYVWDAKTGQVQYKLPGHKACVNDVDFHPLEPIIGSGSSDKSIFLGEIEAS
jgi:Prp8 binding protein